MKSNANVDYIELIVNQDVTLLNACLPECENTRDASEKINSTQVYSDENTIENLNLSYEYVTS